MSNLAKCVSNKMHIISDEHPKMPQKRRLAIAYSYCRNGKKKDFSEFIENYTEIKGLRKKLYDFAKKMGKRIHDFITEDILRQKTIPEYLAPFGILDKEKKKKIPGKVGIVNIPLTPVTSSTVKGGGVFKNELVVQFHEGQGTYRYEFPSNDDAQQAWRELVAESGSPGRWIWEKMRGHKKGEPVTPNKLGPSYFTRKSRKPKLVIGGTTASKKWYEIAGRSPIPKLPGYEEAAKERKEIKTMIKGAAAEPFTIEELKTYQRARTLEELRKMFEKKFPQLQKRDFEDFDFDTSKPGRWVTIKGHHIYIYKGQSPKEAFGSYLEKVKKRGVKYKEGESPAERVLRRAKEKGKRELPLTEAQKKEKERQEKEQLKKKREQEKRELQKRKEIERQARQFKKPKELPAREKAIRKLIEQTGYERKRAERLIDKGLAIKKTKPEITPKEKKVPSEKLEKKQAALKKKLFKLEILNQENFRSDALRNIIQLFINIIKGKKAENIAKIFLKNYMKIKKSKHINQVQKSKLLSQISELSKEVQELSKLRKDFVVDARGWHGESERHREAAKKGSAHKVRIKKELKEVEEEINLLATAFLGSEPAKDYPKQYEELQRLRAKKKRLELELRMTPEQLRKLETHYGMGVSGGELTRVYKGLSGKDLEVHDAEKKNGWEQCVKWMEEKGETDDPEGTCYGILKGFAKRRKIREERAKKRKLSIRKALRHIQKKREERKTLKQLKKDVEWYKTLIRDANREIEKEKLTIKEAEERIPKAQTESGKEHWRTEIRWAKEYLEKAKIRKRAYQSDLIRAKKGLQERKKEEKDLYFSRQELHQHFRELKEDDPYLEFPKKIHKNLTFAKNVNLASWWVGMNIKKWDEALRSLPAPFQNAAEIRIYNEITDDPDNLQDPDKPPESYKKVGWDRKNREVDGEISYVQRRIRIRSAESDPHGTIWHEIGHAVWKYGNWRYNEEYHFEELWNKMIPSLAKEGKVGQYQINSVNEFFAVQFERYYRGRWQQKNFNKKYNDALPEVSKWFDDNLRRYEYDTSFIRGDMIEGIENLV